MSWTDEEIDKLYQKRSENLSFEYKNEFWQKLSASIPFSVSDVSDIDLADREIDQMYQSKSKDLSFSYKSSYWKEMAAMLPQRKKRDFVWFFTSFVFMGLLIMMPIIGSREITTHAKIANVNNSNSAQENNNNSTIPTIGTDSDDSARTQSQNNQQNSNSNRNSSTTSFQNSKENSDDNGKPSLDGNVVSTGDIQDQNEDVNDRLDLQDETTDVIIDLTGKEDDSFVAIAEDERSVVLPILTENKDDIEKIQEKVNVEYESDDIDLLPIKKLDRSELNNDIIELTGYTLADLKMPVRTNVYLELNGGISQSLISPSQKVSYSVGVGIGTQFQKGRFTFITGLNGLLINHDDIVLSRQAKIYDFGSETYSYELKYKQLYSLEASLSIGFRMGRHVISMGCRPSYVVGSKVAYNAESSGTLERKTIYGPMDGINRFGLKPMLGYSVNLSPSMVLGLNLGMNLMPSVKDDFINGVNNKLPLDGQLYLRKSLNFRR